MAAKAAALLFMPIRSGPTAQIEAWLATLGPGDEAGVITAFTQSGLRDWMRSHFGPHRRFTVLRHPVARAHRAFCDMILSGDFPDLTDQLARGYNVSVPVAGVEVSAKAHHAAFVQFLRFLKLNLNGQTNIRVDPAWASQTAILAGFAGFAAPDMVIREEDLAQDLAMLCDKLGVPFTPLPDRPEPGFNRLSEIYDDAVEALTRQAYQRDYVTFGFGPWSESKA
jgi:hypothetical protein